MGVDPQTIRDSMAAVAAANKAAEDAAAARAAAEEALQLAKENQERYAELSERVTDGEVIAEASVPPDEAAAGEGEEKSEPPPPAAEEHSEIAGPPSPDPAAEPVHDKRGLLW